MMTKTILDQTSNDSVEPVIKAFKWILKIALMVLVINIWTVVSAYAADVTYHRHHKCKKCLFDHRIYDIAYDVELPNPDDDTIYDDNLDPYYPDDLEELDEPDYPDDSDPYDEDSGEDIIEDENIDETIDEEGDPDAETEEMADDNDDSCPHDCHLSSSCEVHSESTSSSDQDTDITVIVETYVDIDINNDNAAESDAEQTLTDENYVSDTDISNSGADVLSETIDADFVAEIADEFLIAGGPKCSLNLGPVVASHLSLVPFFILLGLVTLRMRKR